ncbi:Ni/Fe hydrogenase subunit alpha [Candidatus Woesearchaeota archaeon]|nr:Ni/Fe hydrogenase subunit alpha [Candidatus Woesearchaeota archaeon]
MSKKIQLHHLTKIEGHANLTIRIDKGKVKKVSLNVVEGARFFEAIVRGRKFDEVSILTSRICGVCSPIHSITSILAVEDAFGVEPSKQTQLLRELLILGGIIQSHVMHLYFLALPDYKGYSDVISMASKYKNVVAKALQLKALGNDIIIAVGGREVHPFTCIPGGFSRMPDEKELKSLLKRLKAAKKDVIETAKMFNSLNYPKFERETQHFALQPKEYGYLSGKIICVGKACVPTVDYLTHFDERIKLGSTAKFVTADGKEYMVGSLPRINLNYDKLTKDAKKLVNWKVPSYSPFLNNAAQGVELVHAVDRCIEILSSLKLKNENPKVIKPKAGRGIGVTEAPRGILFHDYTFDKNGFLTKANIITPTAQNLKNIELDIKAFLPHLLGSNKNRDQIIIEIEKLIRSYDPCISCSAHFLKVDWE